jgi:hypothetical protein
MPIEFRMIDFAQCTAERHWTPIAIIVGHTRKGRYCEALQWRRRIGAARGRAPMLAIIFAPRLGMLPDPQTLSKWVLQISSSPQAEQVLKT